MHNIYPIFPMAMLNGVKLNSNKKKYVRYINKDKKKIIKKKCGLFMLVN